MANREWKIFRVLLLSSVICTCFLLVIYVYVIYSLFGMPEGNIDLGSTIGSYFGCIVYYCSLFTAIGSFHLYIYPKIKLLLLF